MAENYIIQSGDVVEGKLGSCFMKINGENIPIAWLKNVKATMEKNKTEFARLGVTAKAHRSSGWTGKGEATMYYAVSLFRQMAQQYARTGKDVYVDLVITNDDPTATVGQQTVLLRNVNFDNIVLARLDIEGDEPLDEDINFTFDDFEYLSVFTHPAIPAGLSFA